MLVAALAITAWAAGTASAPARRRSTCGSKRRRSKWPAPTRTLCWWRCTQAPSVRFCRPRSTAQKLAARRPMQRGICCGCWMGCRWKKRAGFMRTAGASCLGSRAGAIKAFCYRFDTAYARLLSAGGRFGLMCFLSDCRPGANSKT